MNVESYNFTALKYNINRLFDIIDDNYTKEIEIEARIKLITDFLIIIITFLIENTSIQFTQNNISSILKRPTNPNLITNILQGKINIILRNIGKFKETMTHIYPSDELLILYIILFYYWYKYIDLLLKDLLLKNSELYNKLSYSNYRLLSVFNILTNNFKNLLNYETKNLSQYQYKYMKYKIKFLALRGKLI
jgi:hypothetical protein